MNTLVDPRPPPTIATIRNTQIKWKNTGEEVLTMDRNILRAYVKELQTLTEKLRAEVGPSESTPAALAPDTQAITIEQIRAVLADKSRDGKTAQVRECFAASGVKAQRGEVSNSRSAQQLRGALMGQNALLSASSSHRW